MTTDDLVTFFLGEVVQPRKEEEKECFFDKICDDVNFMEAYYGATLNKQHYRGVIPKDNHKGIEIYSKKLCKLVKSGKYKTSKYKVFPLYSGGKWRIIYKLPIVDRVVQHAIMGVMEPWFQKHFIVDTYSSIAGRGIHRGLKRLKRKLRQNPNLKYCLKMDIRKFYPSIDKEILKNMLYKYFKHDERFLKLIYGIIDSCEKGVPIGNYTSQYLANFYFTPIDIYIKQDLKCKNYFRYCDDMIVLAETKEELHHVLEKVKEKVQEYHLTLKSNYQIFPIEDRGIDFLGYITRHNYVLVRKHTKKNFIKACKEEKYESIPSYYGILHHCDARNLWKKYAPEVPFVTGKKAKLKDILYKPLTVYKMTAFEIKKGIFAIVYTSLGNFKTKSLKLMYSLGNFKEPKKGFFRKNYNFEENENI